MDMSTSHTALTALNTYTGDNIWEDVVYTLDLDGDATELADPSCHSDVIILTDGTEIRHDAQRGEWVVWS